MTKIVLQTADWDDAAQAHNALATEAKFLFAEIIAEFGRPARAKVVLYDTNGATAQKYDVDAAGDSVYVGPGRAYLYDDDDAGDASVFDGRIMRAVSDMAHHRLILECQDWLSQLADDRGYYDLREDLDGAGLRESELKSDLLNLVTVSPTYTTGTNYFAFDMDMSWAVLGADFTGYKMILPGKNAGTVTVKTGPYTHEDGANMTANGWRNVWVDDSNYDAADSVGIGDLTWRFKFHLIDEDGSLFTSLDSLRINGIISANNTSNEVALVAIDHDSDAAIYLIGTVHTAALSDVRNFSFEVPKKYLSGLLTSDGILDVILYGYDSGGDAQMYVYFLEAEATLTTAAYSTAISITDQHNGWLALSGAVSSDGGVETVETTASSNDTANDMTLMTAGPAVNDAYYFGMTSNTASSFWLKITTQGNWAGTLAWEYSKGADTWGTLTTGSWASGQSTFEAAVGWYEYTFTTPGDWATDAVGGITTYWVRARVAIFTDPPGMTTQPKGGQAFQLSGLGNTLKVGTDLSGAGLGLWETCKYSIVREVYKHIDSAESGDLVTGTSFICDGVGCSCGRLTAAANIEHTSGYSLRHYDEVTRLEILQDLAGVDASVFWVPIGSVALTWKSTFNNGAPTAMTDASVLHWNQGDWNYESMFNEYHVYGARIGDTQISAEDSDATSILTYGIARAKVVNDSGVLTGYDCTSIADNLVDKDKDVRLYLEATLKGLSTLRLGDEVSITSTYLGLTAAVYTITHWSYDSKGYRTRIRLHPRATQTGYQTNLAMTGINTVSNKIDAVAATRYVPDLHTQTWA